MEQFNEEPLKIIQESLEKFTSGDMSEIKNKKLGLCFNINKVLKTVYDEWSYESAYAVMNKSTETYTRMDGTEPKYRTLPIDGYFNSPLYEGDQLVQRIHFAKHTLSLIKAELSLRKT